MKKFARVCSLSGRGMNEGYCFNDGEAYAMDEEQAKLYIENLNLNWDEEVEKINTPEEWFFYTSWEEIEEEEEFYDEEGNLFKECHDCEKITPIEDEFNLCIHCLTHL